MDTPPLPRLYLHMLLAAVTLVSGLAIGLQLAMPTLRQGRLLDEALELTEERQLEASRWLEREPSITAALEKERREAVSRLPHLLRTDEAVQVRTWLETLARDAGFEVGSVRLGTIREGETFDTVPAALQISGDRAELPPFLATFYDQPRVVRLIALDLEARRLGSDRVNATLRWEFAAAARNPKAPSDPTRRWAAPSVADLANESRVSRFNRGRWEALDRAASDLRDLRPNLVRVARMDSERSSLEMERRSLASWRDAAAAERKAVLRKTPLLFRQLDVSAMGRAGLRPGPGGTLQIVDDN